MFLRLLIFLPLAFNPFIISDSTVNDANEKVQNGSFDAALKGYDEAKQKLPDSAEIHLNIGLALIGKGEYEKGVAEFNRANDLINDAKRKKRIQEAEETGKRKKSQDEMIQLKDLYALGTTYAMWAMAKEKEGGEGLKTALSYWKQAAAYLEKVVLNDPENQDALTNFEIALLRAYPSCSKLEDKYEPNNNREDAKFITLDPNSLEFKEELMLCPSDDDYFRIPVNTGEYLIVTAKPVDEKHSVKLRLLEDDGKTRADGFSEAGSKPLKILKSRNVLIKISNPVQDDSEDNRIKYTLQVKIMPPCPRGDDGYEDNDTQETAREIQDGEYPLRRCDNDDDWFKYTLKAGEEKEVTLAWNDDGKRLYLDAMSSDEVLSPSAIQDKGNEQGMKVKLPSSENDVTYMLHAGGEGENFYMLKIANPEEQQDKQKEQQKQNQQQEQQQKQQEQEEQKQQEPEKKQEQPIETMLDNLEQNSENLEAQKALTDSPYKDYVPEKDW
jgi:hypothetical protein